MTEGAEGFSAAFTRLVRATGRWTDVEPDALLAQWELFVADCEAGYPRDEEDYLDELTARGSLERALAEEELQQYPELSKLRSEVNVIDDRFRRIIITDAFPTVSPDRWWSRGMVRYARRRLVDDMKDRIDIELAE